MAPGWWQSKVGFLGTALAGFQVIEYFHNNDTFGAGLLSSLIDIGGLALGALALGALGLTGGPAIIAGLAIGYGVSLATTWVKEKVGVK